MLKKIVLGLLNYVKQIRKIIQQMIMIKIIYGI